MATLLHYTLCPHSRFVRLILGELGIEPQLVEERVWERRRDFLELNPAAPTPVLCEDGGTIVPGSGPLAEYLDETRGLALGPSRLLPEAPGERIEVRRLLDWFGRKFDEEITAPLVLEKVMKRFMSRDDGGGPPEMAAIRAARANVKYHLRYIGWLTAKRNWLAGDRLSYADLAAAAHVSCVDYLGDVPWDEDEAARLWYARIKSRPSFRPLLADRVPGMGPSAHYDDLDF